MYLTYLHAKIFVARAKKPAQALCPMPLADPRIPGYTNIVAESTAACMVGTYRHRSHGRWLKL